jgi:membrane protein YdbS with pleckstrin-like domain
MVADAGARVGLVTDSTPKVADAFAPEGEPWIRVSPKLATAYRISLSLVAVILVAAIVALGFVPDFPRWLEVALLVVVLVVVGWLWWLFGRRTRSWGYAERADDLLVTRGIMFRRLVIVPYGRMQLVDVTAGPIHRMLGITTVQLHTAAATTDAAIPGLTPDLAAALRDRLARRGEQRSAGL